MQRQIAAKSFLRWIAPYLSVLGAHQSGISPSKIDLAYPQATRTRGLFRRSLGAFPANDPLKQKMHDKGGGKIGGARRDRTADLNTASVDKSPSLKDFQDYGYVLGNIFQELST